MRLLLISVLLAATAVAARAVSPAGHFQERLLELQRQGSCVELPQFGVATHQGRNPDAVNLGLISEIHAKVIRTDISWIGLEQHGEFDFGPFDSLIDQLRNLGKTIIIVLAYGHPDHSDGPAPNGFPLPPHTAEQRAAYGRYAQAVAQRYHGPDIVYEIWNEPNLDLYWPPAADAKAYGELLVGASRAIRDVEPNATILPAGLANENNPAEFLHALAAAGALDMVDGVNFHPYRFEGPENSLYDIAEFQSAAAGRADRPLWLTEWGYSEAWPKQGGQNKRQRQAIMIARLMLTAALSKAKASLIYDLIDDGRDENNAEAHFGLFDYDFQPKEAANVFRSFNALMSECGSYEFSVRPTQNIIVAKFSGNHGPSYVIWGYGSGREQTYCFDPGQLDQPSLTDIFGNSLPVHSCSGHRGVTLDISDTGGPLILKLKNSD